MSPWCTHQDLYGLPTVPKMPFKPLSTVYKPSIHHSFIHNPETVLKDIPAFSLRKLLQFLLSSSAPMRNQAGKSDRSPRAMLGLDPLLPTQTALTALLPAASLSPQNSPLLHPLTLPHPSTRGISSHTHPLPAGLPDHPGPPQILLCLQGTA